MICVLSFDKKCLSCFQKHHPLLLRIVGSKRSSKFEIYNEEVIKFINTQPRVLALMRVVSNAYSTSSIVGRIWGNLRSILLIIRISSLEKSSKFFPNIGYLFSISLHISLSLTLLVIVGSSD